MLFIRQSWIKKRTRHTRRLAKRFVRLYNSHLLSYKRSPLEYPNQQPSCQWNLEGSRVNLKISAPFWHILISQAHQDEVELVFDTSENALRWYDYLYRTSKFGSLRNSFDVYPPKQINRTLQGLDTPWFIKPITLLFPTSYWTKTSPHPNLPYLTLSLLFKDIPTHYPGKSSLDCSEETVSGEQYTPRHLLNPATGTYIEHKPTSNGDHMPPLLTRRVVIAIQSFGSESHFVIEKGCVICQSGGKCSVEIENGLVLIQMILLSHIQPVRIVSKDLYFRSLERSSRCVYLRTLRKSGCRQRDNELYLLQWIVV